MTANNPAPTRLEDYAPSPFLISEVGLEFDLDAERTRVRARLRIRRNPTATHTRNLILDGTELETRSVRIDGKAAADDRFEIAAETLTLRDVPDRFELETEVIIQPQTNRSLEGLYFSEPNLCTQCEAEGFRKITWYLDRPDVLARFQTRITGDPERFPVMLSNGNLTGQGTLPDGRHWATWEDPFPKPSYLFALIAGPLEYLEDVFTTRSGRRIALRIYAKVNDIGRCEHAMGSLKRAMRWDEDAYGLEYDLDTFMIVAINDFNMGAMENKGLNVFNSALVLARPDTATDQDYAAIESVIAHEYFHNWTGNRVTCRDWFQLSLKEGLTVFRDQQFSEDVGSRAVERINGARTLRSLQFPEDAGPMAHPVRPDSYIEISNFYSVTIYEKGAELIRMLHTLLGNAAYQAGMRIYFERHDGKAVTIEDFVEAMEAASGRDLGQFKRWYRQAGTPEVSARAVHYAESCECVVELEQQTPPTPGQPEKLPLLIPLRMSLLGCDGGNLPLHCPALGLDGERETVAEFCEPRQAFRFSNIPSPPVLSIARGFSAPVRIEVDRSGAEFAFLIANEADPFNRWDATQEYSTRLLLDAIAGHAANPSAEPPEGFVAAMRALLLDPGLEPAFIAEAFSLPSESNLADRMEIITVEAIHEVRRTFMRTLARELREDFARIREANRSRGPYQFDHESAGRRSLANLCLDYLMQLDDPDVAAQCRQQLETADNMTDSLAALESFANFAGDGRDERLDWFHARWRDEPLVLDKWLSLQARSRLPDTPDRVVSLLGHPSFDIENPNRVRALIGAFCHRNQRWFHDASGAGYRFLSARVLAIDAFNPQIAARLLGAASRWRRLDEGRRERLRSELERILAAPGLSKDCYEIATKTLA